MARPDLMKPWQPGKSVLPTNELLWPNPYHGHTVRPMPGATWEMVASAVARDTDKQLIDKVLVTR